MLPAGIFGISLVAAIEVRCVVTSMSDPERPPSREAAGGFGSPPSASSRAVVAPAEVDLTPGQAADARRGGWLVTAGGVLLAIGLLLAFGGCAATFSFWWLGWFAAGPALGGLVLVALAVVIAQIGRSLQARGAPVGANVRGLVPDGDVGVKHAKLLALVASRGTSDGDPTEELESPESRRMRRD